MSLFNKKEDTFTSKDDTSLGSELSEQFQAIINADSGFSEKGAALIEWFLDKSESYIGRSIIAVVSLLLAWALI